MIILKVFKTCTIIDSRDNEPTLKYKNQVVKKFLSKIVDKDFIGKIEIYHCNQIIEAISNGVVGGITDVDSLSYLKLKVV